MRTIWTSIFRHPVAVILIVGTLCTNCTKEKGTPEWIKERAVTMIIDGSPQTLDPIMMTEVMSATLGNACHAPLVRLEADGRVVPELAESVTVAPDGMSALIQIRRGTKFWNEENVTAPDVAWSLLRLRDSNSPLKITMERVAKCEVVNELELKVHFSKPEPDFLTQIAHLQASILKKDSDKFAPLPLAQHLIGAGAFQPGKFQPGTRYTFERNSGFYEPSNIKTLSFVVKTDPQSQLAACHAGDAQIIRLKGPALKEAVEFVNGEAPKLRKSLSGFALYRQAANELSLAILNWNAEPLNQIPESERAKKLAQISSKLDRNGLTRALAGVDAASSIIPPAALNSPQANSSAIYSPSSELDRVELVCSTDAMSRELAGVSQPYLRAAGLDTEVRQLDPARLMEHVLKGRHQAVILDFEMPVTGVSPWLLFFSPGAFSAFGEVIPDVLALAELARSTLLYEQRIEAWFRVASKLNASQKAWLPLVSRPTFVIADKSVQGVRIDAAGTPYWTHLSIAAAK